MLVIGMKLCKNGEEKQINRGKYFICKISQNACAYVRFCNNDNCFKMLSSFKKCKLNN